MGRIVRVTRGGGKNYKTTNLEYADDCCFTNRKNDRWDYAWVKRNFGINLKPGESVLIEIIDRGERIKPIKP